MKVYLHLVENFSIDLELLEKNCGSCLLSTTLSCELNAESLKRLWRLFNSFDILFMSSLVEHEALCSAICKMLKRSIIPAADDKSPDFRFEVSDYLVLIKRPSSLTGKLISRLEIRVLLFQPLHALRGATYNLFAVIPAVKEVPRPPAEPSVN